MDHSLSPGEIRVLLITHAPEVHRQLATELSMHGIAVTLTNREPVVTRELRRRTAMVLVDLASASAMSPALVRCLNERSRRAPVVGLCDGMWPPLGSSVSALRVDGLARPDQYLSIAAAAAAVAAEPHASAH